ncbi:hypothetical protein ABVT39_023363 [Epinephelus coioides]
MPEGRISFGYMSTPGACATELRTELLNAAINLSNAGGMEILAQLLWVSAYQQLETSSPKPKVPHKPPPPVRTFALKVVVKGELVKPRQPDPFEWTLVGRDRKRNHPEDNEQSSDETKRRMVHQQVVLKECFIPLNPVHLSTAILGAMDRAVPSHLPTPMCDVSTPVPHGKQAPVVKRQQTAVASKRRPDRQKRQSQKLRLCPLRLQRPLLCGGCGGGCGGGGRGSIEHCGGVFPGFTYQPCATRWSCPSYPVCPCCPTSQSCEGGGWCTYCE